MTQEPSAEAMMPGPCVICGLSNYPLSAGGPTICPSCDCGDFGPTKIERQRKEIERLKIESNDRVVRLLAQVTAMRFKIERLTKGLQMLAKQEYDRGYSPEYFAEAILSGDEP